MDEFLIFCDTGIPKDVLFLSLAITGIIIVAGLLIKTVKEKKRFTLIILLIEYLFLVICSTVVFRTFLYSSFERIQLAPFWTYSAVLKHTTGVSYWDIILNVVLFLPIGLLVSLSQIGH